MKNSWFGIGQKFFTDYSETALQESSCLPIDPENLSELVVVNLLSYKGNIPALYACLHKWHCYFTK